MTWFQVAARNITEEGRHGDTQRIHDLLVKLGEYDARYLLWTCSKTAAKTGALSIATDALEYEDSV